VRRATDDPGPRHVRGGRAATLEAQPASPAHPSDSTTDRSPNPGGGWVSRVSRGVVLLIWFLTAWYFFLSFGDGALWPSALPKPSVPKLSDLPSHFTTWRQGGRTLTGHRRSVRAVAFSPDGTTLVSGSRDETVRVWDAKTRRPRRELKPMTTLAARVASLYRIWAPVTSVAISPDSRTIVCGVFVLEKDYDRYKGVEGQAILFDLETGDQRALLRSDTHSVQAVAFSPDGGQIAIAEKPYIRWQGVSRVKLWDVATPRQAKLLTTVRHDLQCLAFSPDGSVLACGTEGKENRRFVGEALLIDRRTGTVKRRLKQEGSVYSLAFAPDGSTLALGGTGGYALWNLETGKVTRTLRKHPRGSVGCVAFSPDGTIIATGSHLAKEAGDIRLWATASGELKRELPGHRGATTSLAFSPDSTLLASGGGDDRVRLWDLSGRKP
jgi:WD40 repeat protein